jgi:hypothetical protein
MAAFVTTNQLGVDLYAAYDAISATLPEVPGHPHVYGSRVTATDGSEWIFGKVAAGATINQYNCVFIDVGCDAVVPSLGGAASLAPSARPAYYQGATQLTAGMAAWFMISGQPVMTTAGLCAANAPLFTTQVSGVLDDAVATGSQYPIRGLFATVTNTQTSSTTNVQGMMTFPSIGALGQAS